MLAFPSMNLSSFPWEPRMVLVPNFTRLSSCTRAISLVSYAKRRASAPQPPPPKHLAIKEERVEDDEGEFLQEEGSEVQFADDFGDDFELEDDEDFEDEFEEEELEKEASLFVGDGAAGGGISLAGNWWDNEALTIAQEVSVTFDGDLKIYAFKTTTNSDIRVRIEKLSTRYGSPSMEDIEAFSTVYRSRLDEAELAGKLPDISLEVSSPGLERVVHVPEELERFKDRPMYVKYVVDSDNDVATSSSQEKDGVFSLISLDVESGQCTWGIADVKVNRQKAGKGRPLSKKQREWRLQTSFESLRLVRLHPDC
ncbi:uncharacterized protein LOC122039831 [Zingiber officinale]|uniref:DUF7912 domain-containing protein n=1 Tax=Zingiber officinale TaxID=94328 RepID=A0A8J5LZR7_ZINOF|nr:uncharacterized protein LOC122039831 [Zingiber officinale]KAG6528499.1 hypothetical protein ZIOFF_010674 [Zingiber officinale]